MLEKWINLLFPAKCPLCRKVTRENGFCEDCRKRFPTEPIERTFRISETNQKVSCLAPLPYENQYRMLVHQFKFRNRRTYAKAMAGLMAEMGQKRKASFDVICFVPSSRKKKRERGYNQSELLARRVGKLLGIPVKPLLKKIRENESQHTLSAEERLLNVKDVFAVVGDIENLSILWIDDVITTGATFCSSAQVLLGAGAKSVCGICFAATQTIKR